MNQNFLEHIMHTEPESLEQKYLFLVDNQNLALNIISAGYSSIALLPDTEGFCDIDSFIDYLDEIAFSGACRSFYCYISACSSKHLNDRLEQYFCTEYLSSHAGWMLFKNKEYLEKLEYKNEMKALLAHFIARFERPPSSQPDLNRFHKFNNHGQCIGVLDMEIVDYLIKAVSFFIVGNTPYLYQNGYYKEDPNGIILKSHIQKLLFRDCIKSTTIQRIYNLLIM